MTYMSEAMTAARKSAGMTRRFVSEKLGIPYNTICNYEYGKNEPSTTNARAMAELYGCTVDELLGIEKAPQSEEPVSIDELVSFLVSAGFIEEGGDLSDEDLAFLKAIIAAIAEWFSDRKA